MDEPTIPNPPIAIPSQTPAPTPIEAVKIKYSPILFRETQALITEIENKLSGKVLVYYTSGSIVGDDVKYFYTHLSEIGYQDKLYLILTTSGGDGQSAYRIASLIKSFCKELVVIIPEKAASAGTMLALAGDQIMMTPMSYLTAVDTSTTHPLNPKNSDNKPVSVELEEVRRAVETFEKNNKDEHANIYSTIFSYIHPVAYGNISRASTLSETLCRDLLRLRNSPPDEDHIKRLVNLLNHELPSHAYPITKEIARSLGIPVLDSPKDLTDLLWKLINYLRFSCEKVETEIQETKFHTEKIINFIESFGRKTWIRSSRLEKLEPTMKTWTPLKSTYTWESAQEKEIDGQKKLQISTLDL